MSETSRWQRWKAFDRRTSNRVWGFVWRYLTPFIAALCIITSATSIGPAWRAHEGAGLRGIVTVTQKDCGRNDCSYSGDFISPDGKDRRTGVGLASGFSGLAVGDRVPALDDGDPNNVYPPGGGDDWIITTLVLVGAVGALLVWIYAVPMGARRRGRQPLGAHEETWAENPVPAIEERGGPGPRRMVTPGPQPGARFALVRMREGYDVAEVDAFVARVRDGHVTSADARNARFTPVRLRQGYDMGEVDDYVDGLAAQLSAAGR